MLAFLFLIIWGTAVPDISPYQSNVVYDEYGQAHDATSGAKLEPYQPPAPSLTQSLKNIAWSPWEMAKGAVLAPYHAAQHLFGTPSAPGHLWEGPGTVDIPNTANDQSLRDLLFSFYGGQAFSPARALESSALRTGKPSIFGSVLSGAEKAKAPDRSLGPFGGTPSEEVALSPKAEAIGTPPVISYAASAPRSKVLAENGVTEADRIKAAEDAFVKAFHDDVENNKYTYFDDWREGQPMFNEHGEIIDIPQISDAFENVSPYGYSPLKTAPPSSTAAGLNAAAQAVDRDLFLNPSSNSGSHYGTLRTPSGKEYKVRVADHPQISSQFDPPDFNIAPGNMTPEEFARLLPTLYSDTSKPNPVGAAIAGQLDSPQGFDVWHGSPHDFDQFDISKIGTGEGAQVYGHGIYTAEDPNIAKHYQKSVPYQVIKRQFQDALPDDADFPDVTDLLGTGHFTPYQDDVLRALAKDDWLGFDYPSQAISAAYGKNIHNWDPSPELLKAIDNGGYLYQAHVNANPEDFLDWHKSIPEQSQSILNKIAGREKEIEDAWTTSRMGPQQTEVFKSAGIPGISYLDAGSRAGGEGSRNYVLFSRDPVDIIHKWRGDQQLYSDTGKPNPIGATIAGSASSPADILNRAYGDLPIRPSTDDPVGSLIAGSRKDGP